MTASSMGQNPLGYTGVNFNQNPVFIPANRAPTSNDIYPIGTQWGDQSVNPPVIYETTGNGVWNAGGNVQATTTVAGITRYATTAEVMTGTGTNNATLAADVFALAQSIVVGAVPAATETNAGIAEIATQVETDAGTDDTRIVTPLKLANFVGAGGFPGSFTDLTATGTVSFTGATGGITMTSATASSFGTTGAGIDLTLDSAGGRVVINGEEAAADAVRILSAAGGLDVDVALQMSLVSSQNAADAIVINSSAGGIDITAAGAAGEDIDIVNTAGSVNITAGESGTDAIVISASIGGIQINAPGAAAGEDIALTATGSSIRLVSTENVSDSIVLSSTNGGIQILAPGAAAGEDIVLTATGSSIRLTATESATDSINIESTAGGINILASGAAAGEDINLTATGSSINLTSTEDAALAVFLHANGGTSETIQIRSDQGTGVASVELLSDVGGITLTAGLATADAINLAAAAGGVDIDGALQVNIASSQAAVADSVRIVASAADGGMDIDSGTGGMTLDTTGALSLDAAAASNFSVSGAGIDLTLASASGSVAISGGEAIATAISLQAAAGGVDVDGALQVNIASSQAAVADAVRIIASAADGGMDIDSGTGGMTLDTTGALSLDSQAASNFTVTGAFDLTLNSTAGSVNITAGESAADSMVLTSNGLDIVVSGAAGRDIDMTNTGGSINITATENVSDAIVINASGAASGMTLDCGTASLTIGTGIKHAVTTVATAATPYAVLGTDYFITTDTTAGILTITLPATPGTGRTVVVYDGVGQAAIGGNITIDGNGNNIAAGGTSAATKVINTAYESYILTFNGTIWCGQNIV